MDRKRVGLVAATVLCVAGIVAVFWAVWGPTIGLLGAGGFAIGAGVGATAVSLLNSHLAERN